MDKCNTAPRERGRQTQEARPGLPFAMLMQSQHIIEACVKDFTVLE